MSVVRTIGVMLCFVFVILKATPSIERIALQLFLIPDYFNTNSIQTIVSTLIGSRGNSDLSQ